jgi:hypothetical protein
MKEAAVFISKINMTWIPSSFEYVLTNALKALSLQNI